MDTSILDWFDINNNDHLRAFKQVMETGSWPQGFIPDNTCFPNCWQTSLMAKMAEAYINSQL